MDTTLAAAVYPDNLAALGVCRGLGVHGLRTAVLSTDRTAPGQYSGFAERVACPPASDEAAFVEFLVRFARARGGRPVLFLTDDSSLMTVHRYHDLLEPWFRFALGPWPVLDRLLLKDALYRALDGVVPVPRTVVPAGPADLKAAADEVGLPAILKPVLRCLSDPAAPEPLPFEKVFGAKAVRVRTLEELRRAWDRAQAHGFAMVLQEEIPGPIENLVSIGVCADRRREAGIVAAFTSRKLGQVPAEFGDGLVVQAAPAPEILPLAEQALRHFGFHGLADIEFKWDPREQVFKLLDINPRPWLWINLPTACGVNLPYAAWLSAMERPIDPTQFAQRDFETRWISMRGLAIAAVHGVMAGHASEVIMTFARHLRGRHVGPLWHPRDPLVRMVLSPGFWWQSLRDSVRNVARLHAAQQVRPAAVPEGTR
jgi:predicted ATP-grasp superfamily ATP-dependent carboligase